MRYQFRLLVRDLLDYGNGLHGCESWKTLPTPNLTQRVASGFGGCKKAEGGCWASFKSVFVYVSERKEKIRAEGDNNYAISNRGPLYFDSLKYYTQVAKLNIAMLQLAPRLKTEKHIIYIFLKGNPRVFILPLFTLVMRFQMLV